MNTLTIRKIPKAVEQGLRLKAKQTKQSLNKTAIELLSSSMGVNKSSDKKRDLAKLSGTWSKEESEMFTRATGFFEKIDHDLWK
jgi:hypothetical protein